MSRPERVPYRLPDAVFERRVRRVWDWLAGAITHGDVGDSIAAGAVFGIAKAGMFRVQLDDPYLNVIR
jgi:hypothetical protein